MTASRRTGLAALSAAAAILLGVLAFRPSAKAADGADGAFRHDCCGTLALSGGVLFLQGKKSVRYRIGRDEKGFYLLPDTYVGTWEDRGFEIDGARPALKLRFDALPNPRRIVVPAASGAYTFTREELRRR